MDNYQPASSMSSLPTQDQEDWSIYYGYMDNAAAALGIDPAVFAGTPGAAPDFTGYVSAMQDPPASFEHHASDLLAHEDTQWNPVQSLSHPCHLHTPQNALASTCIPALCNSIDLPYDTSTLVSASHLPEKATKHDDYGAGADVIQYDTMAPVQLAGAAYTSQPCVPLGTDNKTVQTAQSALSLPFTPVFHCGMHGCQLTFASEKLLEDHQHFHAKHHWIVSRSPWICECGQQCAKLDTLQRHIQRFQKASSYFYCHEPDCIRAFKRKDHLVQHLRHLHKYSDADVHEKFPIHRKVIRLTNPVCPFSLCSYHRDDSFQSQPYDFQEASMPFAKQSDYTKHMKNDHDWSPYPCAIPSCDKKGKNGYFRAENLQKHRHEQHPEAEPFIMEQ